MVDATSVELLAEVLCASSAVLFTFIATFSRSPKAEAVAQNVIFFLLIAAAGVLWWLPSLGGELWGSDYLPRPLALFCIILAISARMNIKGENVSFGASLLTASDGCGKRNEPPPRPARQKRGLHPC